MKIKLDSDGELLLNKTIEVPSMVIVVRGVFHENIRNIIHTFS